ncbi:type II methionyl aminopeptidase [Nanoarchaeota archaeon]
MEKQDLSEWKKAGSIGADVMAYAKKVIKPEAPLLEIAERVENYIRKKKVSLAFPVNLSINDVAAHFSPTRNDKSVAKGLIKIDLGTMKDGFLSDTAASIDLTPENKFKELIKASEEGLKAGIKAMKINQEIKNVGKEIDKAISDKGFNPIRNLSGHKIDKWSLHAGMNVPNYDNKEKTRIKEGIYAVEPFATTGAGLVREGKPSNIYILQQDRPTRLGRDVLNYIKKEYKTLAFCSRWITDKFGPGSVLSLQRLTQDGILHQFSQLINEPKEHTSQSEHTIAVLENKTIVLTERD